MLSIIPTPLGNLRDITLRAIDTLKACSLILCEDTRQSAKLLQAHEIRTPMESFHEHTTGHKLEAILQKLQAGQHLALISDAGTPLISDPGFELLNSVIRRGIPFEVLPGACAIPTALVASGLATDSFTFYGFLSNKSASRQKFFKSIEDREETAVFYESPYRVAQTLEDALKSLGDREAAVARELTKKFEEIVRGNLSALAEKYKGKKTLGEIVILISGKDRKKLFSCTDAQVRRAEIQ